jgi:non-ribosomal peptide synthetase component E (peptide arylation enzyme)
MNVMIWADRHVERYGDYADAVVTPAGAWTNGDIHERSRRLAAGLVGAGVTPGDRIALWPRCAPVRRP